MNPLCYGKAVCEQCGQRMNHRVRRSCPMFIQEGRGRCWFQERRGKAVCVKCGYQTKLTNNLNTIRRLCGPRPMGFGDWLNMRLARWGITKGRYIRFKIMLGLQPKCGCHKRQVWLNRVSDWWRGQS